jgi:hypothetical protein
VPGKTVALMGLRGNDALRSVPSVSQTAEDDELGDMGLLVLEAEPRCSSPQASVAVDPHRRVRRVGIELARSVVRAVPPPCYLGDSCSKEGTSTVIVWIRAFHSPFRRSTTAATLSREASRSIGSIAFKRSLHAAEVAPQERSLLDPKLQNASAIVVPWEEGIIAMKL